MAARKPEGSDKVAGAQGNGKTAQSYIAGIGASGALLAGAVVTFVFLVGTVSFEVWPEANGRDGGVESLGVAELNGPSAGGGPTVATLGETVSLLAASVPGAEAPDRPRAGSGLSGGSGGGDGGGEAPAATPPASSGSGDSGTASGGGGNSSADNADSDRPSSSRPSRGNGSSGTGTSGSATSGAPSAGSGDNEESDRPSSGGRGD